MYTCININFLQYRPTDEEQAIIEQLQAGLHAALPVVPDISGDGWDPDTSGDEGSSQQDSLINTARLYSTACNALLRSAACAYLQVVVNEDCEQSTGSATQSTDSGTHMEWSNLPPTSQ